MNEVECRHHWVLEPPNGTRAIEGVCKYCDARRNFYASEPEWGPMRKNISIRPPSDDKVTRVSEKEHGILG